MRVRKDPMTPLAAVVAGLLAAGLYQPIWEYDAKTLAWDLSSHLA